MRRIKSRARVRGKIRAPRARVAPRGIVARGTAARRPAPREADGEVGADGDRAAAADAAATTPRFPPIFHAVHAAEIPDKLNMVCRGHVRARRCGRRPLGQSRARSAHASFAATPPASPQSPRSVRLEYG